jgi:hypothetical protein
MTPIKKVPIEVYVPAGKFCQGYTFRCPLLIDSVNSTASFCVIIPESFEWDYTWIKKNPKCPSLLKKRNALSYEDAVNHRMRIVKKAAKDGLLSSIEFPQSDI